jgi:ubiquinone/menaquinone biosynthesis C-methylase UbiE
MNTKQRDKHEVDHFTKLDHVWWGLKSVAGQKRYDNKLKKFSSLCHVKNATKILEVGCGIGDFSKRLATLKTPNIHIVATDITPGLIHKAKKLIKNKKITFKVDNLHKLSFKDNSFDIVCGISILHHVDLKKSLSEIKRVLKKDGEIFFTEPNMLNPVNFFGLHIPFLREKMEFSPDETAFTKHFLEKELQRAGFRYTKVLHYDFLHPNTPKQFIPFVEQFGATLEVTPLIKKISGSLIIYAKK